MIRTIVLAFTISMSTGGAVEAQDYILGDLTIRDPVLFKSFASARAAGGYMTIANSGTEPDRLLSVSVEGPMAMIHQSREEDGVVRMVQLEEVEIPAGGAVEFRPGGLHVMIMGLQPGDLPVGDTLDGVLTFDSAGEVAITFQVVDQSESSFWN